jgi:hypothetical protein
METEKFQLCGNKSVRKGAFQSLRGRGPAQLRGNIVSSTVTLHTFNIRFQENVISNGICGKKNCKVISK